MTTLVTSTLPSSVRAEALNDHSPTAVAVERILVATDFSDAADGALDYAIGLARVFGAKITIVHAYEPPPIFPDGSFVAAADTSLAVADGAESALTSCAERHRAPGVRIDTVLTRDDPVRAIIDAATRARADLIVLGTHGRRGLAHVLLGSIAEKVIRAATQPVLIWRSPPAAPKTDE
jgi:nucleotide-binding universal stress UspA family protein